jgi:predicted RNA-binding Zn ribbon-like protein
VRREPAPGRLHAIEDLCNTANRVRAVDELGGLQSAQTWAARNGMRRRLRRDELDRLVAGRETIRAFLRDRDDDTARTRLNQLAAATFGSPAVGIDGQLTFTQASSDADAVAALVAPALAALLRDGLTGAGRRLKACAADDCHWIFFDRSRASTGRWCDMDVCGARHKMRRHRGRNAQTPHHER